jgi:hypothetical protein
MYRAGGQADLVQNRLRESAVVFQAIAVAAAADHAIAFATKLVLQFAARPRSILKENNSMLAGGTDPSKLASPIRGLRYQAGKCAAAQRFGNINLDLVAFSQKAQIQRAQIAGIAYSEKPHGETENALAIHPRLMQPCSGAS